MHDDIYVTLNLASGPRTFCISSVPASVFSDLQRCEWLVPDVADGIHDTAPCEAPVSGPRCQAGHPQVAGTPPLNEYAELNWYAIERGQS